MASALTRLLDEFHKIQRCIQDLHLTNPRDDKKRIEETKGGLLEGSYHWVLNNASFQQWHEDPQSRLLWIKGDPGKGKTMLLCGIIEELKKSATGLLSFFFCQSTDSRISSATAVLRGLILLLVNQQPSLVLHLRKKYNQAGQSVFEDANAWVALSDIFTNMTRDPDLKMACLVVDALDECEQDLPKLLDLVIQTSTSSARIHIEQKLRCIDARARLSLELKQNAEQVSRAVDMYIDHKLCRLDSLEDPSLRDQVRDILRRKANGTFLWVALVVQELERPESWDPLQVLYDRMLKQIQQLKPKNLEICRLLLSSSCVVYRPLYLAEMGSLCGLSGRVSVLAKDVRKIAAMCGSFLTVRDDQVYLIHQSAKDYLSDKMRDTIFPSQGTIHHNIFSKSLKLMSNVLKRDMYSSSAPGFPIDKVQVQVDNPLATMRYSICRSMSEGVLAIVKLNALAQRRADALSFTKLLQDARLFIMYHIQAIQNSPLQVYASALLFSPEHSLIRSSFKKEELKWIAVKPVIGQWSACLQTLEGHSNSVNSVAFSPDSTRLASGSRDKTVKIWDASSGACLETLKGHSDFGHRGVINSVAFSPDSTRLASGSRDKTVKIWDASSGVCLETLEGGHSDFVSVAFSPDWTRLASGSWDKTVKIWDASSGICLETLEGHSDFVSSVAFSPDSTRLASGGSGDNTVKIWDASSSACLETLEGHSDFVSSVAFSPDSTRLASGSGDKTVKIWDASTGTCLQTLKGHSGAVNSVAFSPDSTRLASGGACLETLKGHRGVINSVAFSPDSTRLASGSWDKTVKIWHVSTGTCLQTLKGHRGAINSVAFSPDSTRLASGSGDNTVKIWDASSGVCLETLEGHSDFVSVAFSPDWTRLASGSDNNIVYRGLGMSSDPLAVTGFNNSTLKLQLGLF
ncbi:WD40-repeat-containing domain protein [Paraphoma chrysanthemicola]|nr:WD40-repeat-containing domain protein [Paraphoma chrysanthemicola]